MITYKKKREQYLKTQAMSRNTNIKLIKIWTTQRIKDKKPFSQQSTEQNLIKMYIPILIILKLMVRLNTIGYI